MERINTALGALIAGLVLFISNLMTLFADNPELTFGDIKSSAWVAILGGAAVAFLKDYHAVNTRILLNKATKTGVEG